MINRMTTLSILLSIFIIPLIVNSQPVPGGGKAEDDKAGGDGQRGQCSSYESAERLISSLYSKDDQNPLDDKRVKIAIEKAIGDNDIHSAKKYMKEAGWTRLELYLNLDKFNRLDGSSDEAMACKEKLEKFGINMVIELESFPTTEFYFRNKCDYPVKLAIRYKNWNGKWVTDGWWFFDPNQSSYPVSGGNRIGLASSTFYYYARTSKDAKVSLVWRGEHHHSFEAKDLQMRITNLSKDSDGDYVLTITCDEY